MKFFECVPNVSEGRDSAVIDACARAIEGAGVRLADRSSDPVHHRSVFTYFGDAEIVVAASAALARVCLERIDLRIQRGAHPRIGALDVLPFVPFGDATLADAAAVARMAAEAIWEATGIPSFLYGAAATSAERRELPALRRGGFEGLLASGGPLGPPDVGTVAAHPSAGACAVGARNVLVAFNVVLASDDLALAKRIARRIRERDGGLPGVRALGIALAQGRVQVSCNLLDVGATPLDLVRDLVAREAAHAGVAVAGCELIGLVPRAALAAVVARKLGCEAEALAPLAQPAESSSRTAANPP
ncbi:MAG: glutamate formimidoyltransferase [Vulcanimicrobiaceae bacterium]